MISRRQVLEMFRASPLAAVVSPAEVISENATGIIVTVNKPMSMHMMNNIRDAVQHFVDEVEINTGTRLAIMVMNDPSIEVKAVQ